MSDYLSSSIFNFFFFLPKQIYTHDIGFKAQREKCKEENGNPSRISPPRDPLFSQFDFRQQEWNLS